MDDEIVDDDAREEVKEIDESEWECDDEDWTCPECNGKGRNIDGTTCELCEGSGKYWN